MAKSIEYQPEPAKIGPDAHEELDRLLETLHQHGVLRLVNDLVAANNEVAQVLVKGLQREGTLNVIQNVSVIVLALSSLPPERVSKVAFGLRGIADWPGPPGSSRQQMAPGGPGS